MNARMKIAAPLMLAALGAIAATGFRYSTYDSTYVPAPAGAVDARAPIAEESTVAPAATNDIAVAPANDNVMVPRVEHYSQRAIVTAPRASDDEMLRTAVMDRLLAARLSGRIGVEAYSHTVSLTGRVMSTNQSDRAEMIARSVNGVWDVNNSLRARVGES